jgi:hypothetical protein
MPSRPRAVFEFSEWTERLRPAALCKSTLRQTFVVPAWIAGTQIDMDVSGRILRIWMPAIHAGMTEAQHKRRDYRLS